MNLGFLTQSLATTCWLWFSAMPLPAQSDGCDALRRYFPMHDGDTKSYVGPSTDGSVTVSQTSFGGQPGFELCESSFGGATLHYAYSGTELLLYGGSDGETDLVFTPPLVELDENLVLNGGSRTSRSTASVSDLDVTLSVRLVVTVTNLGSVTVPAGTFENCRFVSLLITASARGQGSQKSREVYVLAPGVGHLRVADIDEHLNITEWADLTSGTVDGVDVRDLAVLSTLASPRITAQPQNRTMLYGSIVTFHASAAGATPLSYQWSKDGTYLVDDARVFGANASTLTIFGAQLEDAGIYSVTITNPVGCATSTGAALTVTPDVARPTVRILSPPTNARLSNAVVMVQVTAQDNGRVAQVFYQLNGESWTLATGTTNWTAPITLVPGTNSFRVYAVDAAGNASLTNNLKVAYVVTSTLTVLTDGPGKVMPDLNGKPLEVGKPYTVTVLPAPGFVFSNWTGSLTSSAARLNFFMQSNMVLQANFVPNPFAALRGSWAGLFYETNDVRLESSGFFSFGLTESGKFSGQLQLAGKKQPFTGQFDLRGQAASPVKRPGTNNLTLELALDVAPERTDRVRGWLRNTEAAWTAELLGDRTPTYGITNLSPFQGRYTLLIPGSMDTAASPGGSGPGTVTVSKNGRLNWTGTLGDATPATQNAPLSKRGDWPLYASLNQGQGSILGWITVTTNSAPGSPSMSGSLSWIKLRRPADKFYPNGFTNDTILSGSAYVAPGTNQVLATNFWQVSFHGGNLTQDYTNVVFLTPNNKLTNWPSSQAPLGFTLKAATGQFSGNVKLHDAGLEHSLDFRGVLLQGLNMGGGFFIGTSQSGQFLLRPTLGP